MKKLILLMMFIAASLMTCIAKTSPIHCSDNNAVTVVQPYDVNCAVLPMAVQFDILPVISHAHYYALKPQSVIVKEVYPRKAH